MSHQFYQVLHLIGVFMTMMALSGLCVLASSEEPKPSWKRTLSAAHGIGLVVVLVAGFGLMAKTQVDWPWPTWIWMKIVVWLVLGGIVVVIKRARKLAFLLWWVCLAIAGFAAYTAKLHPGG